MIRKNNNFEMLLVPVTNLESKELNKKKIYNLYRKPDIGGILIKQADLEKDKNKTIFYGSHDLSEFDYNTLIERPIYKVLVRGRVIESYNILNDISDDPTSLWLDNVINLENDSFITGTNKVTYRK